MILRNLLVLEAADGEVTVDSGEGLPTLVMTDRQAQTMSWALQNSKWFRCAAPDRASAEQRPEPRDAEGRPRPWNASARAKKQIAGDFPESLRG